ncbi:hypothetical protein BD626DRAFT_171217 [Schizophyllum amplum]|uniref:Uncharacterized protein n=1 Tax=Schizophyllum amplum TaxID=97359 RepID=A0A550CR17_9AGAR|nr:hypothetical protein BD626DRAFT_171217 [Auriculariopsis ampla]
MFSALISSTLDANHTLGFFFAFPRSPGPSQTIASFVLVAFGSSSPHVCFDSSIRGMSLSLSSTLRPPRRTSMSTVAASWSYLPFRASTRSGSRNYWGGSGGEQAGSQQDDRPQIPVRLRPPWLLTTSLHDMRFTRLAVPPSRVINIMASPSAHAPKKIISGLAHRLPPRATTCRTKPRLQLNITRSCRLLRRPWHRRHHRVYARTPPSRSRARYALKTSMLDRTTRSSN